MILPDFVIPSRVNQCWQYSGIDSLEHCLDKKHFQSYPYNVEYVYNNRGYRDANWPESLDELRESTWCIGDSFTVGIGSPQEHTWPCLLSMATKIRTINVSMDGASNDWIARKASKILQEIDPKYMIIQWSYISRREIDDNDLMDQSWQTFYESVRDSSWPTCKRKDMDQLPEFIQKEIQQVHGGWKFEPVPDDHRILQSIPCSDHDDLHNTLQCIDQVNLASKNTQVIHTFIPNFVPVQFKGVVESQILGTVIPEIKPVDLARDGHHYDLLTSQQLVNQLVQLLN